MGGYFCGLCGVLATSSEEHKKVCKFQALIEQRDAALLQIEEVKKNALDWQQQAFIREEQRDDALRLNGELLKAADALLGKMGGPNSPVQPVYEDEFLALELLVDKLNGNDVESIEKRKCDPVTGHHWRGTSTQPDGSDRECVKCGERRDSQ